MRHKLIFITEMIFGFRMKQLYQEDMNRQQYLQELLNVLPKDLYIIPMINYPSRPHFMLCKYDCLMVPDQHLSVNFW